MAMPGHQEVLNRRTTKRIEKTAKSNDLEVNVISLDKSKTQEGFKYKTNVNWDKADKKTELAAAEAAANVVTEKRAEVIEDLCDTVVSWGQNAQIRSEQMIARLSERTNEFKKGEANCQKEALEAFKESLTNSGLTPDEQKPHLDSYTAKLAEQAKNNEKAYSEIIEAIHRLRYEQTIKSRAYNSLSWWEKRNVKTAVRQKLQGQTSITSGGLDILNNVTLDELMGRKNISGANMQFGNGEMNIRAEKWISQRNLNKVIIAAATYDADLYRKNPEKELPEKVFSQEGAKDPKAGRQQALKNAQKYCRELLKLGVPENKLPQITISVNGKEEQLSMQELKKMREERGYFKGAMERWRGDWGKIEHAAIEGGGALGFSAEEITKSVKKVDFEKSMENMSEMRAELSAMRLDGVELQANIQAAPSTSMSNSSGT